MQDNMQTNVKKNQIAIKNVIVLYKKIINYRPNGKKIWEAHEKKMGVVTPIEMSETQKKQSLHLHLIKFSPFHQLQLRFIISLLN